MTTKQHLTTKVTTKLVLPLGKYTTVVDHDWPTTIDSPYVDCMLYINCSGVLVDGREKGTWTVRAIRRDLFLENGTVDETAFEDYDLHRRSATTASGKATHLWMGANPGGFLWQVMPWSGGLTGGGIVSMYCTTRYAKVHTKG
jgi:hypothetical protein